MHRYPELSNSQNILIEIDRGGPIDTETVMSLLKLDESTSSNYLRKLHGARFLSRKNVNKHQKAGGRKFEYTLTSGGKKRVAWIKTKILKLPA